MRIIKLKWEWKNMFTSFYRLLFKSNLLYHSNACGQQKGEIKMLKVVYFTQVNAALIGIQQKL